MIQAVNYGLDYFQVFYDFFGTVHGSAVLCLNRGLPRIKGLHGGDSFEMPMFTYHVGVLVEAGYYDFASRLHRYLARILRRRWSSAVPRRRVHIRGFCR